MIAAASILSALRAHWRALAGGVALAAFIILALLYKAEKRHSAKLQDQLVASVEARKQDRASYQNAQVAAAALNKAQVATIEAKQEEITNDVSKDYAGDLARLRDELGRVRSQGRSPQGGPGSAQASPDGKAAQGTNGAPQVCVSSSDVLHGAETELQLDALITWVEEQGKVSR